ncbi:arogenate dehydratase/prephenate dehydratase 2, chloroplastic-like [Ananas comosus]|uniref:Arogenate dehydratase 3, chloroplastic n=1 Tax=Ananas comosus TaxID=4615 RepID=A0A199VLV6_ANACO|nr:arogenate dehydratase/prephenate dehydratase 2, chloroplastic-like [Ananas comosus]OAY77988.1 Arogenate dehydratase 3, chloroplastic [Ananas comosus]
MACALPNPFSTATAAAAAGWNGEKKLHHQQRQVFLFGSGRSRKASHMAAAVVAAAAPGINGSAAAPGINGSAAASAPGIDGWAAEAAQMERLRVAFQGARGAYSEFAAKTAFPECETVPCRAFADAIAAVERGAADRAIVPVESTMEGTALRNYDLLLRHDLRIVREISLFVHYCLLAMPGVRPAELRRVISHPMALAHCGRALSLLGLRREPVEDTAGAVEMLRSRRLLDTAAIASPRAALLYGLDVLAHGLQDESWNVTRFLMLSKDDHHHDHDHHRCDGSNNNNNNNNNKSSKKKKTSMVIAHRGGSMVVLLRVLSAFSRRNINLTKLEVINSPAEGAAPVMILDVRGRGSLRAFPHVLYVDCEGSAHDPNVRDAIDDISRFSVFVRILGSYAADPNIYDLH